MALLPVNAILFGNYNFFFSVFVYVTAPDLGCGRGGL